MKFACFLLLGAALSCTFAEEIKLDEGVLVLTEQNFDQAITDNKYVLVEFCKYCHFCFSLLWRREVEIISIVWVGLVFELKVIDSCEKKTKKSRKWFLKTTGKQR